MNESNPFGPVFEQIQDLLRKIQDKKDKISKGPLDPSIHEQLEGVELQLQLFSDATKMALEESGISSEKIDALVKHPPLDVSRQTKRNIKRGEEIKGEIDVIKDYISKKAIAAKVQERKAKTSGNKRKKKFKRLGGDGWLPL